MSETLRWLFNHGKDHDESLETLSGKLAPFVDDGMIDSSTVHQIFKGTYRGGSTAWGSINRPPSEGTRDRGLFSPMRAR